MWPVLREQVIIDSFFARIAYRLLIPLLCTGGTIAGVSRYLKEQNEKIQVYMMDIPGSGVLGERDDSSPYLKLRERRPEEKHGSSVMEGIGEYMLFVSPIEVS